MKKRIILGLLALVSAQSFSSESNSGNSDNCGNCASNCASTFSPGCDNCGCGATNKTFFSVRSEYEPASYMRLSLNRKYLHPQGADGERNQVTLCVFGGRSTRPTRLGKYFGYNCQNNICVKENVTATPPAGGDLISPCAGKISNCDMFSEYFDVFSTGGVATIDGLADAGIFNAGFPSFQSTFSFEPRHTFVGLGITYRRYFAYDADDRAWWLEIGMPIMHVSNTMHLRENVINDGGGAITTPMGIPSNMVQAFSNPEWEFGRIDCGCSNSKNGLAQLDLTLGHEWVKNDACHLDAYFGVLIPTGNRPKAREVFEAIVGNNHHVGLFEGTDLGLRLWSDDERNRAVWYEFTFHGMYLFEGTEKRSFDLLNRPWSRYMPVFISQTQAADFQAAMDAAIDAGDNPLLLQGFTPGINVFTSNVKVSPGFQSTVNSAIVFTCSSFMGELGYNFFARENECVQLACPFPSNVVLKSPVPIRVLETEDLIINPDQSIGDLLFCRSETASDTNYAAATISSCDLDLKSAAAPAMITNTLYLCISIDKDEAKYPWFAGLGSAYEWSHDNTGMNKWSLWAKAGLNF